MALSNKNILAAMLERATNPAAENVDELSVQIFCVTVHNDPSLIHEAMSLIISKIQSSNVTQSIRGIALLEECMDKCGNTFQDEVSKFRFLNDLIRLVSHKYQGKNTPTAIRDRIMNCLLLWTTKYPDKEKIGQAYDLLRKEDIDHSPISPVVSIARKDTIMGQDEEKFRKLLQSKNAEDFKRANLLVQSRVNQDAKRMELICRHKSELQEIKNTVSLLNQMLDSYEKSSPGEGGDSICLIKELYESCENYVPIVERLPELIDNTNEKLIEETLEASEYLTAVIQRYKVVFSKTKQPNEASPAQPSSTAISTTDLLSGLLPQPEPIKPSASKPSATSNPLDELSEIFGNMENNSSSKTPASLFENMSFLEPSTVTAQDVEQNEKNNENATLSKYDSRKLTAIDIMSEELLKASLQSTERMGSFKKEPERITLNDLAKEKTINDSKIPVTTKNSKQSESIILNPSTTPTKNGKTTDLEKSIDFANSFDNNSKDELILGEVEVEKSDPPSAEKIESVSIVHLADIQIDLDDVCPTTEKLLFDDDIKITLNFTSNRPSPNVSVIVVSVTNQTKLPVTCFNFEASVRKPSKVRLLPPTGDSMPGTKPFRPPTPINLVMLLLNPTKNDVDVTCIVGYKLGDDPDPIKESIVAKNIAYVE